MAEFHFWGAKEDSTEIIKAIFAFGDYQLLPNLHYRDAHPIPYRQPDPSLFDALTKKKGLYVLGPYSNRPVFMQQLDQGRDAGRYYICETRGGPVLPLLLPGHRVVDGIVELAPGSFSRRSEYWDDAITYPIKPSDELKSHYKLILSGIKKCLARKKLVENIWIGTQAWELLSQGKAIILNNGKWWDGSGSFVRSNLNRLVNN